MDLYLPVSERPTPVFLFGHAKGQTLKNVPRDTIKRLLQARIAFVSIEANDAVGDGRPAINNPETWDRIVKFLRRNAAQYRLDLNNLFVGGRSLGSIGAFPYAMNNPRQVRGIFCTQAIPNQGELFASLVTAAAPPCRFVFKTAIGSGDHDPAHGIAIRNAYRKQQIGDRFQMQTNVEVEHWYDGLHDFIVYHRKGPIEDYDPARFAGAIAAFERADRCDGVPQGGTVVVGSSSVRRMRADEVFPQHRMTNRGFGGAHISDINHYVEQTVLKYEPSKVIFFCGGNDLWVGHTVEEVQEDFEMFAEHLFERVPNCELILLALRPSPKRRTLIPKLLRMNDAFASVADQDDRILFLRGSCDRFLDESGEPIESLYASDRQHMNAGGYKIWTEIVTPHLGLPSR